MYNISTMEKTGINNYEIKKLYEQYAEFVYNIALKQLNYNKTDAEDVVQDVFTKIQGKIHLLNESTNIKAYIYRITFNQAIDYIKKQRSQSNRIEKSFEAKEITISDDELILDSMLSKLSDRQREIVLLFEIAGCSQKEIADILGVSVGTVKSTLSRGIDKMAESAQEDR